MPLVANTNLADRQHPGSSSLKQHHAVAHAAGTIAVVEEPNLMKKLFAAYYAPFLTKWYGKVFVIAIFIGWAVLSAVGAPRLEVRRGGSSPGGSVLLATIAAFLVLRQAGRRAAGAPCVPVAHMQLTTGPALPRSLAGHPMQEGQPLSELAPDDSYLQDYVQVMEDTVRAAVRGAELFCGAQCRIGGTRGVCRCYGHVPQGTCLTGSPHAPAAAVRSWPFLLRAHASVRPSLRLYLLVVPQFQKQIGAPTYAYYRWLDPAPPAQQAKMLSALATGLDNSFTNSTVSAFQGNWLIDFIM